MHLPEDIATCMYDTGIDPFTKKPVRTAKNLGDRKLQRALMQFFKPENDFEVRDALVKAGRADLIGGCEGLITADPPKEAIEARRKQANAAARGDHYHTVANPANGRAGWQARGGLGEDELPAGAEDTAAAEGEVQGRPNGQTVVAFSGRRP